MRMSLPDDIELPDNCLVQHFSEEDFLHMVVVLSLSLRYFLIQAINDSKFNPLVTRTFNSTK